MHRKSVTRMRMPLSLPFLFHCLAHAAISAPASAGATVTGRVEGPGHVPVPGARIVLIDVRTRQRKLTWTDEAGVYRFANLSPGTYALFVSLIGFRPSFVRPFAVQASGKLSMNASLQLAMPGDETRMTRMAGAWRHRAAAAGDQGLRMLNGNGLPNEASSGLRFSQGAATEAKTGGEPAGNPSLQLSASADNSFLLTGNVLNVPAPSQQHWKERRMMMRSEQGAQTVPGFGGSGPGFAIGGGPVIFFAGGPHHPRVNRLRGMLFDTYTNSALDARPYPLNVPESPQIPSYSERAGVSLGGPLVIPKIYNGLNKTSFFVHY